MSLPAGIWVALQVAIFAGWSVAAFRAVLSARRIAVTETGAAFPGPTASLRAFRAFFTRPGLARQRRVLAALTALLFASSIATAIALDAR